MPADTTLRSWTQPAAVFPGHVPVSSSTMMLKLLLLLLLSCCGPRAARADDDAANGIEDASRDRRGVIEEEKYFSREQPPPSPQPLAAPQPWLPGPLPPADPATPAPAPTTPSLAPASTARPTDRPTGRGARASDENWIKLPFPPREDDLIPPQPSDELLHARMPRTDFVTRSKALDAAESRSDKSEQRPSRRDDARSDFVRPDEEPAPRPVYPRQALYHPDEARRYYDERPYRDEPPRGRYREPYERRYRAYPRADDYESTVPRKPKRIIYYAHLPEVVRTPPAARRYPAPPYLPYQRFDDTPYSYNRAGRYDYRFRNRYPYAPFRKEARFRDLAGAGTAAKETKEAATPAPKEENTSQSPSFVGTINSHQYHEAVFDPKGYQDIVTHDEGYLRLDQPLFQRAVYTPYRPYL